MGVLFTGSPWPGFASKAQADDLSIRFDEIETFVRAEGPRARIIAQELAAVQADRDRVRSAELRGDQETENLMAELKAGYVRLQLLDSYLSRLDRLAELVNVASTVADSRHTEGELSGVEMQLVQLATHSVDAASRRVKRKHRLHDALWRAEMGIPPTAAVDLVNRPGASGASVI